MPETLTRQMARRATIAGVRQFARDRAQAIVQANQPSNCIDVLLQERDGRSFSMNEEWVAGFHERSDAVEIWAAFEDELREAFTQLGVNTEAYMMAYRLDSVIESLEALASELRYGLRDPYEATLHAQGSVGWIMEEA